MTEDSLLFLEYCHALREYKRATDGDPDDTKRVSSLFLLVKQANALGAGDYIEIGVHRGIALKLIHRFMDPTRRLYGLDTFKGFDLRDIDAELRKNPKCKWRVGNFLSTSPELVVEYLDKPANLTLVEGWFPETFTGLYSNPWRFVHVDVDLYQPTSRALHCVWPSMVPGGIVLVHDYGVREFECRAAVDEFASEIGQKPQRVADRHGSAFFRAP